MNRENSLSRRVDQTEGVERDNKNKIILKELLEIRTVEKEQLLIEEAKE